VNIVWGQLELLADPTRRALYEHVRRAGDRGTGREQAAEAVGISRGLAAFHLDKLVDAGLLTAAYEAPAPRGRGRAPKIYRAPDREIDFSLPDRRYALLGEILAEGIDVAPADARNAALRAAFQRGRAEGDAARQADGRLERLLDRLGFEPEQGGPPGAKGIGFLLRNCPFQRLAARHTELICGINQAFVAGILQGLGVTSLSATLAPSADYCCVRLAPQRT
jgi:predicted ArsR family transcriptional regulator